MEQTQPNGIIGTGPARIDGLAKVTGRARYGADHVVEHPAHAVLADAPIARGRIISIDDTAARAMPGVCEILTFENVGRRVKPNKPLIEGGYMAHAIAPLASNKIWFAGQVTAVVIADTAEIAQAAADALRITYKADPSSATLGSPGTENVKAKALGTTHLSAGDFDGAFKAAPVQIDAWYHTPAQHHNPMELFQTTCAWEGDQVTIWESTQNVRGTQHGVAAQLGLKPAQVRVISPFIGGAFGSRGELGQFTALIAFAARQLGRPVKLVTSREQGFTLRTFRAETRHHLRLGSDPEGHLTALSHDSWELCGRKDRFATAGSDSTARLYACSNVETKVINVEADRQAPGFMRAPPEMPYLFAMESAMDELAVRLKMDPLELRRRNETMVETVTNKPYTSRSLMQCMDEGARRFGWSARTPEPRSMFDEEDRIGWGYATAFYPTQLGPCACRITLTPDLRAVAEVGTHEIGTGIRTVIAMTVADLLGLTIDAVSVRIGESDLPAATMSAGSNSTASVCSVLVKACESIRARVARYASRAEASPLHEVDPDQVKLIAGEAIAGSLREPLAQAVRRAGRGKPIVQKAANNPHGAPPLIGNLLVGKGRPILLGGSNLKDRMQFAFGAHFVEVRIRRTTGEIRVSRMTGVFAGGRIMNRRTAWAQLNGGQIWGVSSALHEATVIDRGYSRYVNQSLAEYHVPVAADIGEIETIMLDEVDTQVNPLGIKGIGELGVTGVNAAIANAIHHATGVRLRSLPIRVGDLPLEALA